MAEGADSGMKTHIPYVEETLTNSLRGASTPENTFISDDYFRHGQATVRPPSRRATPPSHVDIPSAPLPFDLALLALQYLPSPILVLSSHKTVILANDAFGLLIGLNRYEIEEGDSESEEKELAIADLLEGQSLSQIGIDMIQDGQPIWVDWEVSDDLLVFLRLS